MPANSPPSNGWNEWSRHVLSELKEHRTEIVELRKEVTRLRIEIAGMRIKVAAITGIAALLGGAITTFVLRQMIG